MIEETAALKEEKINREMTLFALIAVILLKP